MNSNKLIPMLILQELVQTNKVNKSRGFLAFKWWGVSVCECVRFEQLRGEEAGEE